MAATLAFAGCQTSANSHWEQIGAGPTLEYANAQCSIMSASTQQGLVALGSPSYVAGAQLGNALGNAIRQAQFMKDCMVLQGWKQVPNAKPAVAKTAATTSFKPNPEIAPNMMAWSSANNKCMAGDKDACARKVVLAAKLRTLGVDIGV
ncbi:hypothetical protein [Mesorhizobium sp.]|uniref:hypothetical protein n=1 Tax=Mesorhizobium sp. TaxID=1871066 RepID=UPI000FE54AFA|nr:hypothetical protein [Mesorhizobium sp.]RWF03015.1 MAG: hypothetical protein EOS43_05990 [Mesorhizobium sp.]